MNQSSSRNPYLSVADSAPVERSQFIRRTYMHLAGAILLFIGLEAALLHSPLAPVLMNLMTGTQYSWLIVLGLFMGVSWLAQKWAVTGTTKAVQYAGLGLCVLAYAIIFIPILFIAVNYSSKDVIPMAAITTLGLFLGLTGVVVLTRVDFSFLRSVLVIGGFVALGVIVASILFGFQLGILFAGIMAVFASVAILYNTSAVMRDYRSDQYVAASLTLFASVAMLFFYILQLFMSRR